MSATAFDRYATIALALPNEAMIPLWTTWYGVSAVAGFLSLLVVTLIVFTPSLRKSSFDKYTAALSFPDALFSLLCAVDCFKKVLDGAWTQGEINCEFQVSTSDRYSQTP
jgi:hypothetical protein